jgi:hypothetical protein
MRERSRGHLAPLTRLLILTVLTLLPCTLTAADVVGERAGVPSGEAVAVAGLLRTAAGFEAAARLRDRCLELGIEPESIAFVEADYAFTDARPAPVVGDDATGGSIADEAVWVTVEIRSASVLTAADLLAVLDLGAEVLDVADGRLVVRARRSGVANLQRLPFALEVVDHQADLVLSEDPARGERRYLVQSYAGDRRSFRQALEGAGAAIGRFEPIGQYYDVTSAADLEPLLHGAWWVKRAVDVQEYDRRAHEARVSDPRRKPGRGSRSPRPGSRPRKSRRRRGGRSFTVGSAKACSCSFSRTGAWPRSCRPRSIAASTSGIRRRNHRYSWPSMIAAFWRAFRPNRHLTSCRHRITPPPRTHTRILRIRGRTSLNDREHR